LIVHHTDATREWAYDRDSSTGRLDRGLDDAATHGWLLIDMASEWNRVFPAENRNDPLALYCDPFHIKVLSAIAISR